MQGIEVNNSDGSYPVHYKENQSPLSPSFASQFYSMSKQKRDDKSDSQNESRQGRSIRAINYSSHTADRSRDRDLQMQLEANQSKLFNLAKRIDECLSSSKTNYTASKVLQPSNSSLSKSSISETKEGKTPEQALHDVNSHEVIEHQKMLHQDLSKSLLGSMETTTEEIIGSREIRGKQNEVMKKAAFQSKPRTDRSPQQSQQPRPTVETKKSLQKSPKTESEKGSPKVLSSGLQKQLETVSSATVETQEDMIKQKEKYVSPKGARLNNYFTEEKNLPKEIRTPQVKDRQEVSAEKPSATKTRNYHSKSQLSPQLSPTTTTREARSSTKKKEKEEILQSDQKSVNRASEKMKPQNKSESKPTVQTKPIVQTKQSIRNNANIIEKKEIQREQNKTVSKMPTSRQQSGRTNFESVNRDSVPKGNKTEPYSSILKDHLLKSPNQSSQSPAKSYGIAKEDNLEFIMGQTISPLLNETKSSKGGKDLFTPGYNFDITQNLSMNDTKNISFDSSMFGKDLSIKGDNSRFKTKSRTNANDQSRIRSEYKSNASYIRTGSQEKKSLQEEELEASFTKAFTIRKNKLIKEVPNFEERMESDIYFRRRFQDDLETFLAEYKPKLSAEKASELFERLVEDGRRREVRAHKVELHSQGSHKVNKYGASPKNGEQVNQAFDRLITDAKKRIMLQEEQEKIKIIMQEELEKSQIQGRSKSKMNRENEEKLVMKLTEDADRRRLQFEKKQRAKLEEEMRQTKELQNQRFALKNNKAKSKVKDYIDAKSATKVTNQTELERSGIASKSFHATQKSRSPSPITSPIGEISPGLYEKTYINQKFASPKKRYLNILSPSNKSQSNDFFRSPNKASPNNESLSSLEYLQVLRNNINKHKIEIEDHIQTIKNIDSSSPLRSNPASPDKVLQPPQHARNVSRPDPSSPQKEKNKLQKVTSRYDNVESKVAKHIESSLTKQPNTQSVRNLKNQDQKELSATKVNASDNRMMYTPASKGSQREEQLKEQDSAKKKSPYQYNNFMNDRDAINFVEKLISDFKMANKV